MVTHNKNSSTHLLHRSPCDPKSLIFTRIVPKELTPISVDVSVRKLSRDKASNAAVISMMPKTFFCFFNTTSFISKPFADIHENQTEQLKGTDYVEDYINEHFSCS